MLSTFMMWTVALPVAQAQTLAEQATTNTGPMLVYRMTFEAAGESINYRPFTGGYYIAPITGGPGSLVLTRVTGNTKLYYSYENFGELFLALKDANRKAVLSATAANDVSSTTFYAIGDADEKVTIATASLEGTTFVAREMKGYAVSADSERDLPYASNNASDIGVAGASFLTARLDTAFSERAKDQSATLDATLEEVLALLVEQGYTDGNPTGTGTGSATSATGVSPGGATAGGSTAGGR
jgi:hypothetical protein